MSKEELLNELKNLGERLSENGFQDFINKIKICVEGIVEKNRHFDCSQKILNSRVDKMANEHTIQLNYEDYGKIVRIFQKEIEALNKNYENNSKILLQFRMIVEASSDFSSVCSDVISYLNDFNKKSEIIKELKDDLDAIRIREESITSLETQIENIRNKRAIEIQKIQDNTNVLVENQKSTEIKRITNDIQQIEEQKSALQQIIDKLQKEIDNAQASIDNLNILNKDNLNEFNQKRNEVEEQLKDINKKLDNHHMYDYTLNIQENENALYKLNNEIAQKEEEYKALEKEIKTLDNNDNNNKIEDEIRVLQTQKEQMEKKLSELPSVQEFNKLQTKIKSIKGKDQKSLNSEISYYKSNIEEIQKEIQKLSEVNLQIQQINKQLTDKLAIIRKQKETLNQNGNDELLQNILKEQKLELRDTLTSKETNLQELKNDEIFLESQINSFKKEKEQISEYISNNQSKSRRTCKNRKTKLEKIMIRFLRYCYKNKTMLIVVIGYIVIMHLFLFVNIFIKK